MFRIVETRYTPQNVIKSVFFHNSNDGFYYKWVCLAEGYTSENDALANIGNFPDEWELQEGYEEVPTEGTARATDKGNKDNA